ncbi:MAG: major capsid protein [Spiroplasma phoeniceum]|nr:MAG: major capsid protein [Spiroplasma phoeniceum]
MVACVRYEHYYQQGVEQLWTRRLRNDIYDQIFANIGEQPIKNKEIYFSGDEKVDNEIFGYNEAWTSYRSKFIKVTGMMRSVSKGLDVYHYADNYDRLPKLSDEWLREDKSNIDRALAIKSTYDMPQFQSDFYFEVMHERTMPFFSIPGIDII